MKATKDETSSNFVITKNSCRKTVKLKIEVGGSSKKIKRADFVIRDEIDYPRVKTIPFGYWE